MKIFFLNLNFELKLHLKEFPLPRAKSPWVTAFKGIDMTEIKISMVIVFLLIFWRMLFGKVQLQWQDKITILKSRDKKLTSICYNTGSGDYFYLL